MGTGRRTRNSDGIGEGNANAMATRVARPRSKTAMARQGRPSMDECDAMRDVGQYHREQR